MITRIRLVPILLIAAMGLGPCAGPAAALAIDAVYFAQTHVQQPADPYFGLVGNRDALVKAHVVDPASPPAPPVEAVITLAGQTLHLPLTGPAVLPGSIPDGPGIVQHSFSNSFTGLIPKAWVQPGLSVTVTAGSAQADFPNLLVGAPTKVVMTMFDVQYFADTNGDYPAGWQEELEAKWPVAALEVRRIPHVVFPELVIPPRPDVGAQATRVKSKADYTAQTGLPFDGEQAAALAWNAALKRAAGRSGRISLYFTNIYGVNAGGQAGGFAGVGNGTSVGILHHELGHALSLPHWGDNTTYPYKGAMYGISAPAIYNETHAGPAWAFDLPTRTFIPCTVQPDNVGGHPTGTYKADPMQGGGSGWQEAAFLMNHFSDYSAHKMRAYLESHVLVWNDALGNYASWNQTARAYTSTVTNNGVSYPVERDVPVISVMASISGAKPAVNMVYPPIGPYTAGLIRIFDPRVAADRSLAASIYAPAGGCDLTLRVVQGGAEKFCMLAAPWEPTADPLTSGSLKTEAINLPAAAGQVTMAELLLTPDAQLNGLPANPQVLYTWAPVMPDPATFAIAPTAAGTSAVTMTATTGTSSIATIEYLFTETTGNPGGTSSGWQASPSYIDTGLRPATSYAYTVTMRAGTHTGSPSAAAYATTGSATTPGTILIDHFQSFADAPAGEQGTFTVTASYDAGNSDKLVVAVSTENGWNQAEDITGVTYNASPLTRAVQGLSPNGSAAAAIFYLDNPGPAGPIVVTSARPNSGMTTIYALSGTSPGAGATGTSQTPSVPITTIAGHSLVIAHHFNGEPGNVGSAATADPPLTQTGSYVKSPGNKWTGAGAGYQQVPTAGLLTPSFSNVGSGTGFATVAAEFLAAPLPDYQAWAAQFPAANLSDPAADYDGDGQSNNAERIWGLDPTRGASSNPFVTPLNPAAGTFAYTRRNDSLTGMAYQIWTSTNLVDWQKDATAGQVAGPPDANGVESVSVTLSPALLGGPRLFVQVRATAW